MRTQPSQPDLFVEVVESSLVNDVIEIRSTSNPNKFYSVDTVNGRCSCPAWIYQRGERKPCKHLRAMGFTQSAPTLSKYDKEL